jgi:antitoxin (DNA-binding transcriptional repressor) of toxin-antitoxin stability system
LSYIGVIMDFVSVRELRTQPGEVWRRLAEEHALILTRNGKPFAILTETSPRVLEQDLQTMRAARFGRALDSVRKRAAEQGTDDLQMDEINDLVREARDERRHETGD